MLSRNISEKKVDERTNARMRRVRSKNTGPEMVVRRLLHGLGYRYVLHDKRLPGCPDLVFPSRSKIVFVHGCFWHGHSCKRGTQPKTNKEFWMTKINYNRERYARDVVELESNGWGIFLVWECETHKSNLELLKDRLVAFLDYE